MMATSLAVLLALLSLFCPPVVCQKSVQEFNFEVGKRVVDRLVQFLSDPTETNSFIASFRKNGGFTYGLTAADRDDFIRLAFSLALPLVYCGLEDGTHLGVWAGYGFYKEPGNGGYSVNDTANVKHLKSCINYTNGEEQDCLLRPGERYIRYSCTGDEKSDKCNIMEPCADEISQTECLAGQEDEGDTTEGARTTSNITFVEECTSQKKWCRKYTIETVPEGTKRAFPGYGYVPLTSYCQDVTGQFTQEPGEALDYNGGVEVGTCYYGDGVTAVNRSLSGNYAYCGVDGQVCNDTFAGGWYSEPYDPRYRPWYIKTKIVQVPNWSPPYVFTTREIGITHSHPIYTTLPDGGGRRFDGVLAIDYRFRDFARFLVENYKGTTTSIVIYEDEPPHFLIGTSTGTEAVGMYLTTNSSIPCDEEDLFDNTPCDTYRVPITDLSRSPLDEVLFAAFKRHSSAGYPMELLSVKASDDVDATVYISQSVLFVREETGIRWRIIINSPGAVGDSDTILVGSELFGSLIAVAGLGFCCCILFFVVLYRKRKERAVINGDWRFTCAFILGCALLNLSSFTLLGQNTDGTCLLRMWSFHFCFALALAPLLVKVYRMYRLVGMQRMRRTTISNFNAATWTLPIILVQAAILVVVTFVDPPKQTEVIENDNSVVVQRLVCDNESDTTFIVQLVFEAGLVLAGCVLAYLTRNLANTFGESKQLIFAMHNIAFVGTVIVAVVRLASIDSSGTKMLQAIAVFWGTVFSTAAFVIPKLLQVRQATQRRTSSIRLYDMASNGFISTSIRVLESPRISQQYGADRGSAESQSEATTNPAATTGETISRPAEIGVASTYDETNEEVSV